MGSERPGFVCGLAAEAACLPDRRLVRITAADAERARTACAELIAAGATALVSFGVAGGLRGDLRPGHLIRADRVLLRDGTDLPAKVPDLVFTGVPVVTGAIFGSDLPITLAAAKRALFEATGALAVDMESQHVATAARAAGLPFSVVRVVLDPADRDLPASALVRLDPEGRPRPLAIVAGLPRRPWEIPALVALGRDHAQAMRVLRKIGPLLSGTG
ncbi:MAG: hypothetical protein U1E45_00935 [Geminicoccaceae bacterium]